MTLEERPPSRSLVDLVESVWAARGAGKTAVTLPPRAGVNLVFNLGAPHRVLRVGTRRTTNMLSICWTWGAGCRAVTVQPQGELHLLGVTFLPGGAHPLYQSSLAAWAGQIREMRQGWPADERDAWRPFLQASTDREALDRLEEFLAVRCAGRLRRHPIVRAGVETIRRDLSMTVGALSHTLGVSPAHLHRLFAHHVGVSPVRFRRLHRLEQLMKVLLVSHGANFAELATEYGFSDQAHLNREFKALAGISPTKYLQRLYASTTAYVS